MSLTVQNLRAVGTGVEPASLLPGQIAFNITDKVMYVGDGSSFKTDYEGNQVPGVPGEGWYAMPMDFDSLSGYYVPNPEAYGDIPTDQQVLTWSTALNHPIWTSGGGGGGNQVYIVTDTQVASSSGATTSDKISSAIGVASPDEGDVTIVTGLPDDVYEGLYFFTTQWVKGAAYAYPSASEVIYNNTGRTLGATVQAAIDDLDDGLTATTAIANTANSTANSALSIASAALPRSGGTMTGTIVSQNINVPAGFSVLFNNGITGSLAGITDSTSTTSSNLAASATGLKAAYDLANAALARSGGTMTGAITFVAEQVFPVSGIQDASTSQKGVVQVGTNIDVAAGVISVANSTTSNKGVVQLDDTLTSTSLTLALTARAGKNLQDQIDALTLASNVTLAGSLNATTGLLDSVTTAGAGAGFTAGLALPAAAAGNADYYVLVTIGGSYNPPGGGGPYNVENGDWFLSDGAVWQYLGVGARPQSASYTTAGIVQLADPAVTYTGTSDTEAVTPNSLQDKVTDSVATTDSNLIASATAVKAAYDVGTAAIPCSTITAVGDIVVGGAGPAPTALPVGSDGQVLVANSACATGLEWVSDTPGDVTSVTATSPVTADNTDPQNPVIGIDAASTTQPGAVQLNDTVTSTSTTEAATANALKGVYDIASVAVPCASFTTLGELLTGTGAGTFSALPVGADGQVLLADSLAPEGLAWGNACYVPDACFTTAGDLIVGTGAGTYVALPVGTTGQSLVVDLTCTTTGGLKWGQSLVGYTCAVAVGNTALGQGAGDSITTGLHNTSIGACAGTAISAGDNNTLIGFSAGDAIAGGNSIVGVGQGVLGAAVTAAGTVAIGATAGAALTSGANTTLVGFAAGDSITTGARNTVIGHTSGGALTTGADNTIIGALAANLNTGTGSTILGACAGSALTLGGANVFLGAGAGDLVTTGFNNTIIGDVGGSASLSGNLILAAGTTVKFQANNSGAWSPDGTDYGTIGQVLTSNGTVAAPSWCTLSLACVPCAAFTAVGDILVGTGAATFSALPLGTTGQALVVDTTCASGVKWVTASGLNLAGFTCSASPFNTALGSSAGAALTALSVANTAIGYAALDAETSGDFNVAIGHNALTAQNGASGNVAIGGNAGAQVTNGANNVLIGCNTGDAITTGADNIAIGGNAGGAATTGAQSVFIGSGAGQTANAVGMTAVGFCAGHANITSGCVTYLGFTAGRNATGLNNTYVGALTGCAASNTSACGTLLGFCAGSALTTGNGNTLLGFQTGRLLTTGGNNTAIGNAALQTATVAANNVAIGCGALRDNTANENVAVGSTALAGNQAGQGNTALGNQALASNTNASNSTAVGFCAGRNSTGACNTFIGSNAGIQNTTGALNIFIGAGAGDAVTTGSTNTIIGDVAGSAALTGEAILAAGTTIKFQANGSGAWSPDGTNYGTADQVLQSNGNAAVPTWVTPQTVSTTATKATTSGTPINLLSWTGSVRMGDLTVMATDNATNVAWGNVTIASDTGAGSSIVTTSGGTFGTFAVISGGGGETIVQFTPSATLATVNFVYKYTASFGAQPTVL